MTTMTMSLHEVGRHLVASLLPVLRRRSPLSMTMMLSRQVRTYSPHMSRLTPCRVAAHSGHVQAVRQCRIAPALMLCRYHSPLLWLARASRRSSLTGTAGSTCPVARSSGVVCGGILHNRHQHPSLDMPLSLLITWPSHHAHTDPWQVSLRDGELEVWCSVSAHRTMSSIHPLCTPPQACHLVTSSDGL